ncbi:Papain family cysteine protease [uncultured Roseburia sp.]|uniref:Lectin like domain-containing protein n=1 Tax=Brotonthovivens ammoniilytica TaxID=2981725 RepID=A0ABT2TJF4_9FIRM|nr:C1 family peptidase [Brotonthovivens ammoniilytica]MCU6762343.1 lectin like domain-containing protein [Brotonthovivens ammoniilytica]SCI68642.1 Papain family cysteine protease [uncultured Roseburia sp.]
MKKKLLVRASALAVSAALLAPQATAFALELPGIQAPQLVQRGGMLYDESIYEKEYSLPSKMKTRSSLPEKYDLREQGLLHDEVRFQNPWGACWAFAGTQAIESSALKQKAAQSEFSEKALAWYAYTMQNRRGASDDLKEGAEIISENGDRNAKYKMGNNIMSMTAQLSSWNGASLREDIPYQDKEGQKIEMEMNGGTAYYYDPLGDWTLPYENVYDDAYHVQEMQMLYGLGVLGQSSDPLSPAEQKEAAEMMTDNAKQALFEKGPLFIGFYAPESRPDDLGGEETSHFNWDSFAQYSPDFQTMNHAVTIVGWDDTFSKDKFTITPPGDGAWIVKNSWSDKWGDEGYFYLSYYDTTVVYYSTISGDYKNSDGYYTYDHNYQYDYAGLKYSSSSDYSLELASVAASMGCEPKIANVFTAQGPETLTAVSALTFVGTGAVVETKVYRNLKDSSNPESGELAAQQEDEFINAGYYTLPLKQAVELKKGETFSVVQKVYYQSTGGYDLPIEAAPGNIQAVESTDSAGNTDILHVNYKVTAEPGQSFLYLPMDVGEDAAWYDVADSEVKKNLAMPIVNAQGNQADVIIPGNVMIKAFTVDSVELSVPKIKAEAFDSNGASLGVTEYAGSIEKLVLPEGTASVVLTASGQEQETVTVTVDGKEYQTGDKIPKEVFSKEGAVSIKVSAEDKRGNVKSQEYTLKFAVKEETEKPENPGGKDDPTNPDDGKEPVQPDSDGDKTPGQSDDGAAGGDGNMADQMNTDLNAKADPVKTGDTSLPAVYGILAAGAAVVIVVSVVLYRKKMR